MCTAITYRGKDHYFGRNLDNMESYGEEVVIVPRRYALDFRRADAMEEHYAMIGVATVIGGEPLYYDAVNEKGLCMAGLNFPGSAVYFGAASGRDNIAHFEIIPWILGQCGDLDEARRLLARLNIDSDVFAENMPAAELHWIVADKSGALTVESAEDGLHVYENEAGVLTNNPPFPVQAAGLDRYMGLSAAEPVNTFAPALSLAARSRGTGAIGLPGDLSSESRFVRAVFAKENSVRGETEDESVSQFFHILDSVAFPRGCCDLGGGRYETTLYSGCCNTDRGIYYYTTYENRQITAVDMHREDLDGSEAVRYAMRHEQQVSFAN